MTDSDFDGLVCGVLLKEVYKDADVFLSSPVEIDQGEVPCVVDSQTVIADLAYIKGCGLYFDHHESNAPSVAYQGVWKLADSAAILIFDFFKESNNLSRYEELVKYTNKVDSAEFTLEEFKSPNRFLELGLIISRDDREFSRLLIDLFLNKTSDEVFLDKRVINRLEMSRRQVEDTIKYIKENIELESGIAFIDITNFQQKVRMNSYLISSLYPKIDAIVVFKGSKESKKVSMYVNSFNKDRQSYNLLDVALQINPKHSGGHIDACGFAQNDSIQNTKQKILKLLNVQSSL